MRVFLAGFFVLPRQLRPKGFNDGTGSIQNLQAGAAIRCLIPQIVNDCAIGGIFPKFHPRPPKTAPWHTVGMAGFKQVHGCQGNLWGQLMQRCNIIQNPECPAVGCHHQVFFPRLHHQVVNGGVGQIALQRLPVCAIVE